MSKIYVHLIWPERPAQGPEPRTLTSEFGHMEVVPGKVFRARDRHAERLLAAYPDELRLATPAEVESADPVSRVRALRDEWASREQILEQVISQSRTKRKGGK